MCNDPHRWIIQNSSHLIFFSSSSSSHQHTLPSVLKKLLIRMTGPSFSLRFFMVKTHRKERRRCGRARAVSGGPLSLYDLAIAVSLSLSCRDSRQQEISRWRTTGWRACACYIQFSIRTSCPYRRPIKSPLSLPRWVITRASAAAAAVYIDMNYCRYFRDWRWVEGKAAHL